MYYDPMLAKLSAWGDGRDTARRRLLAALADYVVLGFPTCVPFLVEVLDHPAFIRGDTHTHFLDEHFPAWSPRARHRLAAAIAAAIDNARPRSAGAETADERPARTSPWEALGRWRVGEVE